MTAGTMFELVQELKDGAETLKQQTANSISINAGTELFIEFVTLFPHEASVCTFLLVFTLLPPLNITLELPRT